ALVRPLGLPLLPVGAPPAALAPTALVGRRASVTVVGLGDVRPRGVGAVVLDLPGAVLALDPLLARDGVVVVGVPVLVGPGLVAERVLVAVLRAHRVVAVVVTAATTAAAASARSTGSGAAGPAATTALAAGVVLLLALSLELLRGRAQHLARGGQLLQRVRAPPHEEFLAVVTAPGALQAVGTGVSSAEYVADLRHLGVDLTGDLADPSAVHYLLDAHGLPFVGTGCLRAVWGPT